MADDLAFRSFLQAGFESSTQKRRSGERLDLTRATSHDRFAVEDFQRLQEFGIRTVRESARWYLIEQGSGKFDFASLACILDAAAATGTEVILDLLHFGWPDYVDPLSAEFPEQFGRFTAAVVGYLKNRRDQCRFISPVNEISFLAWAGGEVAAINPYRKDCSGELKRNLVRASVRASEILLNDLPGVRLVSPEPVIHIIENPDLPGSADDAERYRLFQFESWDMLAGKTAPELGGRPEYLDILGLNFYDRNEWVHHGMCLGRADKRYRPFRHILSEVWTRYQRPMFISETGTEDGWRAEWFNYICDEVAAAMGSGVPVEGICLYPILNHPGWEDDRHCQNGLFDLPDPFGNRNTHWPLAHAVRAQQRRFSRSNSVTNEQQKHCSDLFFSPSLGVRFSAATTLDEPVCEKR